MEKHEPQFKKANLNEAGQLDMLFAGGSENKNLVESEEKKDEFSNHPLGVPKAHFFKNFIIAQTNDELVIIDQHAAHERIIFEKLKDQKEKGKIEIQELLMPEILETTEPEVENLREYYVENVLKLSDKKNSRIIIDKFPFQTVSLPLINFIFPEAKIIFAHRHPYDTVLSCFQQCFEPNNAMANLRSLRESSEIYDLTMKMWVRYKENLNLNFTMSKYESLIDNFEVQTKKIMDFLEIKWNSNIKNYRETALNRIKINTPSSSQVVQPLYKTSIAKWENYKPYFEDCHVFLENWVKYFNY